MFHVEQFLDDWFSARAIPTSSKLIHSLEKLIIAIYHANKKFNITGFSTQQEITENLVLSSLVPFLHLKVPRGTSFVDMGSGAGIPGVPLCIFNEDLFGTMVDSSGKKSSFIASAIEALRLSNATVLNVRGEEMGRDMTHREKYSMCFSRAFSSLYAVSEICAPLLSIGGFLYIYSGDSSPSAPANKDLDAHMGLLGLSPTTSFHRENLGVSREGIFLQKTTSTPDIFPRRYAVIKRESRKVHGSIRGGGI